MDKRTLLVVLGSGAVLLAVVLGIAGAPAWGWVAIAALGVFTAAGATVAPRGGRDG